MEFVQIKDIRAGQKNINVMFIVLEVSHPTITKENREVRTFKVADPTACMNVSIWDEPGQLLMPGDIVRLTKGYASVWRQCLTLYSGKNGEIQKVGEFCMAINEQVNMSDPNPMLAQQMVNQSGSGPPGSNVNNTITNNGNANSISGQAGRQSSLEKENSVKIQGRNNSSKTGIRIKQKTKTRKTKAAQSNATTPGGGAATGSTTAKSGNGGGGNGGSNGGGSGGSGSGLPGGGSVRYSSSDSTTKSAPTGKSNSRGRGGYRNGGRNDRR